MQKVNPLGHGKWDSFHSTRTPSHLSRLSVQYLGPAIRAINDTSVYPASLTASHDLFPPKLTINQSTLLLYATAHGRPSSRYASTRLDQISYRSHIDTLLQTERQLIRLSNARSAEEDQKDMLTRGRLRGQYFPNPPATLHLFLRADLIDRREGQHAPS